MAAKKKVKKRTPAELTHEQARRVRGRLEAAMAEQIPVHIKRRIPDTERITGFVAGIGTQWLALAVLDDARRFDGYVLVRLADVYKALREPDADPVERRIVTARGEWPIRPFAGPLDDTSELLKHLVAARQLVCFYMEYQWPDGLWVGDIVNVGRHSCRVGTLTPEVRWSDTSPGRYDFDEISKFHLGSGYLEGLALVAGPRPNQK